MPAVSNESIVLVTGVTGYIAAWAAKYLLEEGYTVRGTVRDQEKAKELQERFAEFGKKFQLVTVKDIQEDNAFREAVKGVDGVLHIASPFVLTVKEDVSEIIDPAVKGTLNLLRAAADVKTIRRVVITSSFAAMMQDFGGPHTFDENTWNETSSQKIKENPKDAFNGYMASKAEAEKAAWNFVKEKRPSFDIAVINPVYVFGPFIHPVKNPESVNTSVGIIFNLLKGGDIPEEGPHSNFVDVRDVARAHVRALQREEAGGHRHLVSAGTFSHGQAAGILKRHFGGQVKTPKSEEVSDFGYVLKTENDKKNLDLEYVPFEKSIVDTANDLKRFL